MEIFNLRFGNRFPIVKKGSTVVYQAKDDLTDLPVAVKVHTVSHQPVLNRYNPDQAVYSENVVHIIDFAEDTTSVCIAMELCTGGNLSEFLAKHGGRSDLHSAKWFFQIVQALQAFRDKGFIYNGLNPNNVLLSTSDYRAQLKVLDCRLAKLNPAAMEGTISMDEVRYRAPETLRLEEYAPGKEDVWSMGLLFFHILAGYYPITGKTLDEIKISQEHIPQLPDDILPDLRDLIERMLVLDPTYRISFQEVYDHFVIQGTVSRLLRFKIYSRNIVKAVKEINEESKEQILKVMQIYNSCSDASNRIDFLYWLPSATYSYKLLSLLSLIQLQQKLQRSEPPDSMKEKENLRNIGHCLQALKEDTITELNLIKEKVSKELEKYDMTYCGSRDPKEIRQAVKNFAIYAGNWAKYISDPDSKEFLTKIFSDLFSDLFELERIFQEQTPDEDLETYETLLSRLTQEPIT